MTDETTEQTHHVNESADKIRLDTKVVRGSGTRDQETIKVKIKGDDPEECVERLNETIGLLESTHEALRGIQPDGESV